tara:strand:- start:22555 stop:22674 length:120 start_codon:yes stop_codon:yes gene_type:complete
VIVLFDLAIIISFVNALSIGLVAQDMGTANINIAMPNNK